MDSGRGPFFPAISMILPRYITPRGRNIFNPREFMADEHIGQSVFFLDIHHQVQYLRLHRDIQGLTVHRQSQAAVPRQPLAIPIRCFCPPLNSWGYLSRNSGSRPTFFHQCSHTIIAFTLVCTP
jgi:hypothetical protein